MDNLSHALIGTALIALTPPGTPAPVAVATLLGAEAPDFDLVMQWLRGQKAYLKYHRGPTHGLAVLPLWALGLAGLVKLFAPTVGFGTLFWWTLLGGLSHVVFDFGNDYGTQGLWPFSSRRIALDFIPIIDLGLIGLIAAGWIVHWLWPGHRQVIFVFVWILISAYMFARYILRGRAWQMVAKHFHLEKPCGDAVPCGTGWKQERITIHPSLLSLNAWRYVLQAEGEYLTGMVWVREGRVGAPMRARNDYDKFVTASLKAPLVSTFAEWVRRPRVMVEHKDGNHLVRWTDSRYEVDNHSPFSAYAWLDDDLTLLDEGFGKQRPENIDRNAIRRRIRLEMGKEEV